MITLSGQRFVGVSQADETRGERPKRGNKELGALAAGDAARPARDPTLSPIPYFSTSGHSLSLSGR
jgi:hypothetical protein